MNTAVNIVMVPVVLAEPPQQHPVHITEEDTAVIKCFAGSLYFLT
jgi:hypothetical protein